MRTSRWTCFALAAGTLVACGDAAREGESAGAVEEPPPEEAPSDSEEAAEPAAEPDWGDVSAAVRETFRVRGDEMVLDRGERFPRWIEHRATGLPFAYVRTGAFELGSPFGEEGRYEDEDPPRRVRMTGFYVSRLEVTYAAWKAGGGREIAGLADDHPVAGVDWFQARAWCARNGFSLPSEAQWEYAASGSANVTFPWGLEPDARLCNALGRSEYDRWVETSPAGAIPTDRSWCGAFDMAGNVGEWCLDGWWGSYESIPDGALDPLRMEDGESRDVERVVRGGSYASKTTDQLRTAYRNSVLPTDVGANLGFRVVAAR